jgi:hypothetical protein
VTDVSGKTIKVGSPVLYFKAEPTKKFRVNSLNRAEVATLAGQEYTGWVFDFNDNLSILNLSWLRELPDTIAGNTVHYSTDPDNQSNVPDPGTGTLNPQYFYQLITARERIDASGSGPDFIKPQNQETFILLSAGWDGIFGTKDDVGNFDF